MILNIGALVSVFRSALGLGSTKAHPCCKAVGWGIMGIFVVVIIASMS